MKVLVIAKIHPILRETLEQASYTVDVKMDIERAELISIVSEYQGLVVRSSNKIDKELIDQAWNLKFIARAGSGMELIDTEYAESKGITCLNSPGGNAASVAEHVIGMVLSLLHNIRRADAQMRKGQWIREDNRGAELSNKTLGIIGAGNTGTELMKKLQSLGCRVIAHDILKGQVNNSFAEEVSLAELQAESDIISVHIPLNEANAHLINSEFIRNCAKPIILVNASRGGVLNTKDILDCISSGKITGLGMDVFENEKPSTFSKEEEDMINKLIQLENVILTPHIAGWSFESEYNIADFLVNKILKLT